MPTDIPEKFVRWYPEDFAYPDWMSCPDCFALALRQREQSGKPIEAHARCLKHQSMEDPNAK